MTDPTPLTYDQLVEANETLRQQLSHAEHQVLVVKNAFCDLQENLFRAVYQVLGEYERATRKMGVVLEAQRTRWVYDPPACPDVLE